MASKKLAILVAALSLNTLVYCKKPSVPRIDEREAVTIEEFSKEESYKMRTDYIRSKFYELLPSLEEEFVPFFENWKNVYDKAIKNCNDWENGNIFLEYNKEEIFNMKKQLSGNFVFPIVFESLDENKVKITDLALRYIKETKEINDNAYLIEYFPLIPSIEEICTTGQKILEFYDVSQSEKTREKQTLAYLNLDWCYKVGFLFWKGKSFDENQNFINLLALNFPEEFRVHDYLNGEISIEEIDRASVWLIADKERERLEKAAELIVQGKIPLKTTKGDAILFIKFLEPFGYDLYFAKRHPELGDYNKYAEILNKYNITENKFIELHKNNKLNKTLREILEKEFSL